MLNKNTKRVKGPQEVDFISMDMIRTASLKGSSRLLGDSRLPTVYEFLNLSINDKETYYL